jgi:hypothetical protein
MSLPVESLPQIRFDITEASRILRMSRATVALHVKLDKMPELRRETFTA